MWTKDDAIEVLDKMAPVTRDGMVLSFEEAIKILHASNGLKSERIAKTNADIIRTLTQNKTQLVAITEVSKDRLIELVNKMEELAVDKLIIDLPWEIKIEADNQER